MVVWLESWCWLVVLVWFGMLLGFEATSLWVWCFGVSCVCWTRTPVVGVWSVGVGLLFGNCIVNASIL